MKLFVIKLPASSVFQNADPSTLEPVNGDHVAARAQLGGELHCLVESLVLYWGRHFNFT